MARSRAVGGETGDAVNWVRVNFSGSRPGQLCVRISLEPAPSLIADTHVLVDNPRARIDSARPRAILIQAVLTRGRAEYAAARNLV